MPFEMQEVTEIGRIKRQDSSDIVVRKTKFKGVVYFDIRHFVKTQKFTGFSKGLSIPEKDFPALMEILKKIEAENKN